MAQLIPSEISFDWFYMAPFLLVVAGGYVGTLLLTRMLNRFGLSQYFWKPEVCFLAFWLIFSSLIGLLLLPP